MENKRLSFATVVASPTATSWSQSYTAGTLFAVVSLSFNGDVIKDISLPAIGKEILDTLEAEYFATEDKNLASIRKAFEISLKPALEKEAVVVSAGLFSVIDNVLYIIILGGVKALIGRGDALGTLLTSEGGKITSASGFLQDNDTVILQTEQFGKIVSREHLKNTLDHNPPTDIAENLSPLLHEREEGGATAIIISYKQPPEQAMDEQEEMPEILPQLPPFLQFAKNFLSSYTHNVKVNLNRKQKLFLSTAVLLVILLLGSGLFVMRQKESAKNQALFQEVFDKAKTKYDEGQSLLELNKNLARDDFAEAQKILDENKEKFPKNSPQKKQIIELLEKVENSLKTASSINAVEAKTVDQNSSELLSQAVKNTPIFITQDEKNIYGIVNEAVFAVDKKSKNKKTIIPNKSHWSNIGGLGVYFGNLYVLDKKEGQIFKFTATDDGFTKTNYLIGGTQDFSKASSISIDGSVWVLLGTGEIKKFTRGKIDDLKISSLDKPFSKPSRIFTDADTNNLYVLDNGNNRIVVLSKSGIYQTQYQTNVLKDTVEFDVLEKEKKIFVLSQKKIWQIDLQ